MIARTATTTNRGRDFEVSLSGGVRRHSIAQRLTFVQLRKGDLPTIGGGDEEDADEGIGENANVTQAL